MFRQWLDGAVAQKPLPPSSDALFQNFGKKLNEVKSISDEICSIPKYLMVKDKILLNSKIDFDSLESIFDCDEINRLDGIKFSWSDKWIHIRKSNTEPIIRIFAEAPTKDEVDELVNTLKNYVK